MTEEERDRLLLEVHTGLVGTADGRVQGLRPMVVAIEDRHKRLDAEKEGARWRRWADRGIHSATGAVSGWLAAHFGK